MSKKHSQRKNKTIKRPRLNAGVNERLWIAGGFAILIFVYFCMIDRFFPNAKGRLGSDYSYFLPALLDGYFWFHTNGLFHVPWFTPSFCGGSLVFPNLQLAYYSVPQFLTFLVDPLTAIRITVFVFAFVGGAGFYLLLRRAFRTSRWASLLGCGLFLFNGFYFHRMIIGHFGYHPFMLLPLVAFFSLRPLPDGPHPRAWQVLFDGSVAGMLVALMAMSDFVTLLIPGLLSVVVIGLVHGIWSGEQRTFWVRLSLACFFGFLLSLAKLTAIVAFMQNAPRSNYLLPGVDSLLHAFELAFRCLFVGAEFDVSRSEWLRNAQWILDQHEWEFSVSLIPLLFLFYAWIRLIGVVLGGRLFPLASRFGRSDWLKLMAIGIILLLPVFLNVYSPTWNAFLKNIPILQSSSTLFRWFILYIPCVILATALILEKFVPGKYQAGICIIGLIGCLAAKSSHQNLYYAGEPYNPKRIIDSYREVKSGRRTPEITGMGDWVDESGKRQFPVYRNDSLTRGFSQIYAYESLFGYRLEYLPIKTLHPGPALDDSSGVLNVKNPASYLWPGQNHCQPGDHFKIEQRASAESFLKYKPFPFRMSLSQKAANWTNFSVLIVVLIFQAGFLGKKVSVLIAKKHLSPVPVPESPPVRLHPQSAGRVSGLKRA